MPTQNVNLTPELDQFVRSQVKSGFFNNASEVHRAALTAMTKAEEERLAKLDWLRREIQIGIDDLDSGESVNLQDQPALHDFLQQRLQHARSRSGHHLPT